MSDFTIVSTNAPLVEVAGTGPYVDLPGGLAAPANVPTTASVDLLSGFVRAWRVDADPSVQTTVGVPSSPFGVFVQRRVCQPRSGFWRVLASEWLRHRVTRIDPSVKNDFIRFVLRPCTWQDVGKGIGSVVVLNGGDVAVVSFVVP